MTAAGRQLLASLISWGCAVAIALAALASHIGIARNKPFHIDEGLDWAVGCAQPPLSIVRDGADRQCSRSPAYFLVQHVLARFVDARDDRIALAYRTISLASVAALVCLCGVWLARRLGPACAVAALASLLGQPDLHDYATTSRPYAFALMLFAVLHLAIADTLSSRERLSRPAAVAVLAALLGSFSLVTLAAQAVVACAVFIALAHLQGTPLRRRASVLAAGVLAVCGAAAAYYYFRSHCRAYDGGVYSALGVQGPLLVRNVLRMLWTDGIWGNLLFLAGCAAPFWCWRERERSRAAAIAWGLGLLVLVQLALTVLFAAQVVWANYFFLPRIFLYLVVCRAILMALGVWAITRAVERVRPRFFPLAQGIAVVLGLGALGVDLLLLRQDVAERAVAAAARAEGRPCLRWELPLSIVDPDPIDFTFGANTIVDASRDARRCGATPASEPRVLLVQRDGTREILPAVPPGARLVHQCGRVVVLRSREDR